jgi:diphthamide synthase (EF-2-diphthine--ammonia ligase)
LKKKAIFNWSGGKDSALALYKVLKGSEFEITCLFTSVNNQFQGISLHGVRVELLEQQTKNIGKTLEIMQVPEMPSMEVY